MGRASIVSGGEDGQYTITLKPDNTALDLRINTLAELINKAQIDIDAAQVEYDAVESAEASAKAAFNSAISDYRNGLIDFDALMEKERIWLEAFNALVAPQAKLNNAKLRKTSLEAEKSFLSKVKMPESTVSAWCADLTEDLSGEVGTIELNGIQDDGVLIRPGYSDDAAYDCSRDGRMVSPYWQSPSGAFLSWALKPGWQKWRPTYRAGTITSIDDEAGTCSVTLDPAFSDQTLDVNQSAALTDVEFDYMGCGASAFEADDYVVVQFTGQDFAQPKVIGFVQNPKTCSQQKFYSFSYRAIGTGPYRYTILVNAWNIETYLTDPSYNSKFYTETGNITVTINGVSASTFIDDSVGTVWEYTWATAVFPSSRRYEFSAQGVTEGDGTTATQVYLFHDVGEGPHTTPVVVEIAISGTPWQSLTLIPSSEPPPTVNTACFSQAVGNLFKAGGGITDC